MKFKKQYLIFSGVVLLPGIVSLILFGLNLSAEFTGGSILKYRYTEELNMNELEKVFGDHNVAIFDSIISDNTLEIRTSPIDSPKFNELNTILFAQNPGMSSSSFETIGPSVGKETTKNAFKALAAASGAILLYIAFAFRNIPKPYVSYRFGVSALIAMLHDAFLLFGVFSILGHFSNVQVDILFITATLTVIGFSIHDTIVVFDRIRENLKKLPSSMKFVDVVNYSIVETLNRSIATSLTVLMTLLSLYILGGDTTKNFVLALLIGILSGTYSSIFTASPILVIWEEYVLNRKKRK